MAVTLGPSDIEDIVVFATAAPSIMNSQPWRFRAQRNVLDLYADRERILPAIDQNRRALYLSCGAALFNLRLAIAAKGRAADVRLLPTNDPLLLVRVTIGATKAPSRDELDLYTAIPQRRTSRLPFYDRQVSEATLAELTRHARQEGASLEVLSGARRADFVAAVMEADRTQVTDPVSRHEIRSWVDRPVAAAADGIPRASLPPRSRNAALVRDVAMGEFRHDEMTFEREPLLLALRTPQDGRVDALVAGQALERVLLAATTYGLSTSFLDSPLEVPWLRRMLFDGRSGVLQTVLRVGYGPKGPATPRRPVTDVLEFVD
jgi:hypothetical protein